MAAAARAHVINRTLEVIKLAAERSKAIALIINADAVIDLGASLVDIKNVINEIINITIRIKVPSHPNIKTLFTPCIKLSKPVVLDEIELKLYVI